MKKPKVVAASMSIKGGNGVRRFVSSCRLWVWVLMVFFLYTTIMFGMMALRKCPEVPKGSELIDVRELAKLIAMANTKQKVRVVVRKPKLAGLLNEAMMDIEDGQQSEAEDLIRQALEKSE